MPSFGKSSKARLETCDKRLQVVLEEAIQIIDFSVLCGHRGEEEQNKFFEEGKSKLQFPQSKHNAFPSKAVDIAPYPIDWADTDRFYYLAGIVMGLAASRGIKLRWGGDWDSDNIFSDNKFDDLPHFQIED